MIRFQAPQIEVWEPNATLRALISETLDEAGFEVIRGGAPSDDAEAAPALVDLLILDVEGSEQDFDARLQAYQDAGRAVLLCGLRNSRERFPDTRWLERPFSPMTLLAQCRELLGLGQAAGATRAESDDTPSDELLSDTRRLTIKETVVLEAALGLQQGKLVEALNRAEQPDAAASPGEDLDDELAVLELQGDDIQVVDDSELNLDLSGPSAPGRAASPGGELVGVVERSSLDGEQLEADASLVAGLEVESAVSGLRSKTMNSTMPDVPAVKRQEAMAQGRGPSSQLFRLAQDGSQVGGAPGSNVGLAPSSTPFSQVSGVVLAPQLEPKTRGAADLLAGAWSQIGSSARQGDRREHIEKILRAVFAQGLEAGEAQVRRIPAGPGFSGSLAVLGLLDLLVTIRDRALRGRLELAIGPEYFVLYLDAQALDQIENLTGNDEQLLLDTLAQMGCLGRADYDALRQSLSDPLAAPLRMQLRERRVAATTADTPRTSLGHTHPLVDEDDLREARRLSTLQLFKKIRHAVRSAAEPGSFAFMEILPGAGHAWPVDALGLNVDDLLSSARREDSSVGADPGKSELY